MFPDSIIQRLHDQEVDGGAHPADAQLEAEHHVELLALEPGHGVGVESHVETLPSDTKTEPRQVHEPETLLESSNAQENLTEEYEDGEDDGPESEAKDGVYEKTPDDREDDVWPGVAGVERCELRGGEVESSLYLNNKSSEHQS